MVRAVAAPYLVSYYTPENCFKFYCLQFGLLSQAFKSEIVAKKYQARYTKIEQSAQRYDQLMNIPPQPAQNSTPPMPVLAPPA